MFTGEKKRTRALRSYTHFIIIRTNYNSLRTSIPGSWSVVTLRTNHHESLDQVL